MGEICVTTYIYRSYQQNEGFKDGFRSVVIKMQENSVEMLGFQSQKLKCIEDDKDVRHLVYNRLIMNPSTTDYELQREVMELYGERYPAMSIIDWGRIIREYTFMTRDACRLKEYQNNIGMAAEP